MSDEEVVSKVVPQEAPVQPTGSDGTTTQKAEKSKSALKKLPTLIRLDRTEFFVLGAIFCCALAIMFSVGVLLGVQVTGSNLAQFTSFDSKVAESSGHHETRNPASHVEAKKSSVHTEELAGAKLRQAYFEAKKQALSREFDREEFSEPVSLSDVKTVIGEKMDASSTEGRTPASETDPENSAQTQEAVSADPLDPKKPITKLFERRPASINNFEPVFGDFTVVIATYPTQDEAMIKVKRLREGGQNEAYFRSIKGETGEQWFRVGVGSYDTKSEAERVATVIKKRKLSFATEVKKVAE